MPMILLGRCLEEVLASVKVYFCSSFCLPAAKEVLGCFASLESESFVSLASECFALLASLIIARTHTPCSSQFMLFRKERALRVHFFLPHSAILLFSSHLTHLKLILQYA